MAGCIQWFLMGISRLGSEEGSLFVLYLFCNNARYGATDLAGDHTHNLMMNLSFVPEFHLTLGRMNIEIDQCRVDINE